MKIHFLVLGFVALAAAGCSDNPTNPVFVGSGGGATSGAGGAGGASSGEGGHGGAINASSGGVVLPGTLAPYPLAVTADGHAWLFSGSHSSQGPLDSGDWLNARLSKFDAQGTLEFDAVFAADGFRVEPRAIHSNAQGHVVLIGHVFRSTDSGQTMDIGGQSVTFPFAESAFVAKLDANGNLLWAKVINKIAGMDAEGFPGSVNLIDVGTDDVDHVYVAANLHGTADFGGGPVTHDDSIVVVLSPDGNHLEDRILAPIETGNFSIPSVLIDLEVEPSGATWLARSSFRVSRVERFNEAGLLTGEVESFMCWVDDIAFALDGKGGFFWVHAEDGGEQCSSMTVQHVLPSATTDWLVQNPNYHAVRPTLVRAGTGHAWMSLGLEGTIDLGNSSLVGTTVDDIWLAKMDEHGNISQTETYGGPGVDTVVQMGLDASGARFLTGYFAEQIDFGSGVLENTSGNARSIFLVKLQK
jgi:hypothetical protein